jgi:hypothetical protein
MELEREVVPDEAVDFAEYLPVLQEAFERVKRSVRKHGTWDSYDAGRVFEAVAGEFDEYREAFLAQELRGRHGQVSELYDVVVTAVKGIRRLSDLDRVVDREECRQVANDPPDDLPVLEVS